MFFFENFKNKSALYQLTNNTVYSKNIDIRNFDMVMLRNTKQFKEMEGTEYDDNSINFASN